MKRKSIFTLSIQVLFPERYQRGKNSRDSFAVLRDFGFKGGAVYHVHLAGKLFVDSLKENAPHAQEKNIPIKIEATNRYEFLIVNTLEYTERLIQTFNGGKIRISSDTYHMNIEEPKLHAVLEKYYKYFDSVHFFDDNSFSQVSGRVTLMKLFVY